MEDKRKHPRVDKEVKIEVRDPENLTRSTSRDLGNGGIFISTPEPMKIGTELELSLQLPGSELVNLKGVVRWVREEEADGKKAGMGIEFSEPTEDKLNIIKKLSDS